ncbi:hypothetical protein JQ615_03375 [Bradyrhizobium jicamae]|uniref:Uncharacterized protein n=1 Tax=Bradyrhizobium jicamae TaxID=280332 RepID=A0ABS5FCI8_9BRAD|nr:hypothetical protein [Bradyrhizobium jicamae]MBR0794424.1 hypothetical protein [Bradyrhizobium jicamae]
MSARRSAERRVGRIEKGPLVRFIGWILLLIGALLCATIAWAALGFLLMGIGLISLQVAERSRRRPDFSVVTPPGIDRALKSPGLQPPKFEPVPESAPPRQASRVARLAKSRGEPYDKEAWRVLIERDPDLAKLTQVLADYGPQYVDELAISYLAVPDKTRLGAIVDGIIARARDGQGVAPPAPASGSRPPPLPRPEPQIAIAAEGIRLGASRPSAPASTADELEASLIAAIEGSSIKATAAPVEPPRPARENRPSQPTRREPAFSSVPKDPKADLKPALKPDPEPGPRADPKAERSPPPLPEDERHAFELSLLAAIAEASVSRANPPKPAAPALVAKQDPESRTAPGEVNPPPAPLPAPASASAALEASLLAAITEASARRADPPKPVSPTEVTPEPDASSTSQDPKPAPRPASPAGHPDDSLLAALAEISGANLPGPAGPAKPEAAKDAANDTAKDTAKDASNEPLSAPDDDELGEMIRKFAPDSSFLRKQ